jgi:hypothetical protein
LRSIIETPQSSTSASGESARRTAAVIIGAP